MVLNRQRAVRVPLRQLTDFLARARHALRLPADALTVCLVTNAQMARWNRAYRGKNGPTDVLSFLADTPVQRRIRNPIRAPKRKFAKDRVSFAPFTSAASYLGDIAIAPALARDNARRFGRTLNNELRVLILHGILHLMGYDHETDNGQMERRERRLRHALGIV